LNQKKYKDWDSFHKLFSKTFNFPDYYGENMNAWIDCMDKFINDLTLLDLSDCSKLRDENSEIMEAILKCSAFVNYRKMEYKEEPVLLVSMFT